MEEEKLELQPLPLGYISYSQVRMYKRCPQQWYYRYKMGLKMKPRSNIVFGTGIDEGLKTGFNEKINCGGDDVKIRNLIIDKAISVIEQIVSIEEIDWAKYDTFDKLKDDAKKVLKVYYDEVGKKLKPKEIGRKFEIEFENVEWKLIGEVDAVEEKLIDWKTSIRRYDEMYFIFDEQMKIYKIIFDKNTEIHALIRKKEPEIQIINVEISEEAIKDLLTNIQKIVILMKTGVIFKRNDYQFCSWCGFREVCQK